VGNIGEERRRIEVLPVHVPDRVPHEVPQPAVDPGKRTQPGKPAEPAPGPAR
jgi:hypothetical protein